MSIKPTNNLKSANTPILAYHGTDGDFVQFDVTKAAPNNIGLHFGTREAALARIEYIRSCNDQIKQSSNLKSNNSSFRLLTCELTLANPLRIDDVFGHSYARIFDEVEDEARRQGNEKLLRRIDRLSEDWMSADDDPKRASGAGFFAYCKKLDRAFIRLFRELGYDSLVYTNEIEGTDSNNQTIKHSNISYCIFSSDQVKIIGEEIVHHNHQSGKAA